MQLIKYPICQPVKPDDVNLEAATARMLLHKLSLNLQRILFRDKHDHIFPLILHCPTYNVLVNIF